jgi:Terminase small subunit
MSTLPNPRHERFAQELAGGKTADEAYQLAGYRKDRGNAARLTANDSIRSRVAELQTASAEKAAITKAWVLGQLCDVLRDARADRNHQAANRALELVGKEIGMFVDRKVVGMRRLDDMSREELESLLVELGDE